MYLTTGSYSWKAAPGKDPSISVGQLEENRALLAGLLFAHRENLATPQEANDSIACHKGPTSQIHFLSPHAPPLGNAVACDCTFLRLTLVYRPLACSPLLGGTVSKPLSTVLCRTIFSSTLAPVERKGPLGISSGG